MHSAAGHITCVRKRTAAKANTTPKGAKEALGVLTDMHRTNILFGSGIVGPENSKNTAGKTFDRPSQHMQETPEDAREPP